MSASPGVATAGAHTSMKRDQFREHCLPDAPSRQCAAKLLRGVKTAQSKYVNHGVRVEKYGMAPVVRRPTPVSVPAHLTSCGTIYVVGLAARADRVQEGPQPACVRTHSTSRSPAQLSRRPCAGGRRAEGRAAGRRCPRRPARTPHPHGIPSTALTIPVLRRQAVGMPRGGVQPGARGEGPSGHAPAARGPCVHGGRQTKPPDFGLRGCAMDGGASQVNQRWRCRSVCTSRTNAATFEATPAQAPEGWLPTKERRRAKSQSVCQA